MKAPQNRRHPGSLVRRLALIAAVAIALAIVTMPATGAMASRLLQTAQRPHLVTITEHDFFFTMPNSIPTGLTEFIVVNHGKQTHMAQFFKLKSGVTQAQLIKALQAPTIATALKLATPSGGSDSMKPGGQQHVIRNLSAGRYVVVCFDAGPNGVPHFVRGMHTLFTVSSSATARTDTDNKLSNGVPVSSGTVILKNFSITVPANMHTRGAHTFKVVNQGSQSHEFQLLRMSGGKGKNAVLAALKANKEPPGTEVGGSGALAPGQTAWIETDLGAGTYVALCEVPDIKTGKPHALMGMITQFTVK